MNSSAHLDDLHDAPFGTVEAAEREPHDMRGAIYLLAVFIASAGCWAAIVWAAQLLLG